jgi:plasmid stabilization system protein ParE
MSFWNRNFSKLSPQELQDMKNIREETNRRYANTMEKKYEALRVAERAREAAKKAATTPKGGYKKRNRKTRRKSSKRKTHRKRK